MEDLISIIVPVYNVEKYLNNCIKSIIGQTYKNIEIILVDDGSTDNSSKICDDYAKKDKRIKVIHQKNSGLSEARNIGIKNASGTYIGFVDSDDYIAKDMFEYLFKLVKTNHADISICNYSMVTEYTNEDKSKNIEKEKIKILDSKDALKELLSEKRIQNYAWNKLYKKSLFENLSYPAKMKMEDLGTTYKLFLKAKKIILSNQKKYFYLQRPESILNNPDSTLHINNLTLSLERYNYLNSLYPTLLENDLNMIKKILEFYRTKDDAVYEYIIKKDFKSIYFSIFNKNKFKLFINSDFKLKLRILIFNISEKLYRAF